MGLILSLFVLNGVLFFGTIAAVLGIIEISDLFRVPSTIDRTVDSWLAAKEEGQIIRDQFFKKMTERSFM